MVSVLCVAPFNNPHITPIYDCLADTEGLQVTRACWHPVPAERLAGGWEEMGADWPYLQPWRRAADRMCFLKHLLADQIAILPGFFHYKALPAQHYLRRLSLGGSVLLWSEPFLEHPRTSTGYPAMALRRLLLKGVDSPGYHLLAIGEDADHDYAVLGIRKWHCWEFCFSVDMPDASADRAAMHHEVPVSLLYSGSLIHRKGVDVLIKALAEPCVSAKEWRLRILGGGPLEANLRQLAAVGGIAHKIEFLRSLPVGEARSIYPQSDILVLPSRFDGWGAVVNEAMRAGLAIVASNKVGSARTMIEDGREGFLFDSENYQELAKLLRRLIDDRGLLAAMQTYSRNKSILYRPEEVARRLAGLCLAIAHGEKPPLIRAGPCRHMGVVGSGLSQDST